MKSKNLFITIGTLATLALLAGCAQGTSSPAATAAQSPTGPEPAPLTSITISGNDQMKFDITNFTVAAGTEITLTFKNVGTMPKESMGHNLVVLVKETDPVAFANASIRHPKNDYVAADMIDSVIAATPVLGPGESATLTFRAPDDPGDYPYVCSFPGHTLAGMRGVMQVK